jgi:nitrite reductase/ring-hydroxylating ferredoxin subunit/uncharacterized membrane protein
MATSNAIAAIEEAGWTDEVGNALQGGLDAVSDAAGEAAQPVKNALHGTWLGHPLHPVLTDVPIGAWTTALALDVMDTVKGGNQRADAAQAAVAVGLVGAAGAAITGLNDWQHTDKGARRLGVAHALLNVTATTLYLGSLLLRKSGRHGAGRGLGFLGFAVVCTSAYLGGHLVYGEGVGVDHAQAQPMPSEEFVAVLPDAELAEGQMRKVEAHGAPVLLARVEGRVHALAHTCSHLGGPLSEGELKECSVQCPWHGSRFSLEDGRVLDGPATFPQPCFETRVNEGQIEVRAQHGG